MLRSSYEGLRTSGEIVHRIADAERPDRARARTSVPAHGAVLVPRAGRERRIAERWAPLVLREPQDEREDRLSDDRTEANCTTESHSPRARASFFARDQPLI